MDQPGTAYCLTTGVKARRLPRMTHTTKSPQGLYRAFNAEGELLYVGISRNVPRRLQNHGVRSFWFNEVTTITITRFEDEDVLRQAELLAITVERPKYNIMSVEKRPPGAPVRGVAGDSRRMEIARLRDEGHSLTEIATVYGITKQRVAQLLKQHDRGYGSWCHL